MEPVGRCAALLTDVRRHRLFRDGAGGGRSQSVHVQLKCLVSIVPLELPQTSNLWEWLMPPQAPPLYTQFFLPEKFFWGGGLNFWTGGA